MREYCRGRLAGDNVLAILQLHDELLRNASGEILERAVRQL